MATKSTVIALLSATLSLGTSAALAALAIDRDRHAVLSADAPEACPPGACTIVTKTTVGGAPSAVEIVPGPISTAPHRPVSVPVAVAFAASDRSE